MKQYKVSFPKVKVEGDIYLGGSKSISNRVLVIQKLIGQQLEITHLSDSDDTVTMRALLDQSTGIYDVHHAGTAFRFLTAYLAITQGTKVLTGSSRMQQRPIRPLVDALRDLGANITYINNEGYPPLKIDTPHDELKEELEISASISSQYISALLLIAPSLINGLKIKLIGDVVSRPYIDMTISIMRDFGADVIWKENTIIVKPVLYKARPYRIEADWSAASYYYAIAGLSEEADIRLHGLFDDSTQGDAAISHIAAKLGVSSNFSDNCVLITKDKEKTVNLMFEYDFIKQPDIAQSISVWLAGNGVNGLFSGLQTLSIKETDRVAALQTELMKVGVFLSKLPAKFSKKSSTTYYMQEGQATYGDLIPAFDTYQDHRMAMSFATLAVRFHIIINDPMVVTKSYPTFWDDLKKLGFVIEQIAE